MNEPLNSEQSKVMKSETSLAPKSTERSKIYSKDPQVMIESMRKFAQTEIYRRCIDEDTLVPRPNDEFFPFDVDKEALKSIMDTYKEKWELAEQEWSQQHNEMQIPNGFDLNREVKDGTQNVVRILHRSGLVDTQAIRGAAQFVGPGNTVHVGGMVDHEFAPTSSYTEWEDKNKITKDYKEFGKTLKPPPFGTRNQFMQLRIGGAGLRRNAWMAMKNAESSGKTISPEEALRIAILGGCAHEYGHAIKRSLDNQDVSTQKRAIALGFIRDHELLGFVIDEIHDEWMARSIENAALRRYLESDLGFTENEANNYLDINGDQSSILLEATYAFLEYATTKGFTPDQIIKIQNVIGLRVGEIYQKNHILWHTAEVLSYMTNPYSEEQLKTLLKKP